MKTFQWLAALLFAASLYVASPMLAADGNSAKSAQTKTPITHVVIIFQENESFDHYFGTYPVAANPPNETQFKASPRTPAVNGLNLGLLTLSTQTRKRQRRASLPSRSQPELHLRSDPLLHA